MKVQVRNRLQRWRYTSIGALPRIIFFVLFGLTLLLPQTSVEAAGTDKLVSGNPGQKAEPATGSLLEKIKSHEE